MNLLWTEQGDSSRGQPVYMPFSEPEIERGVAFRALQGRGAKNFELSRLHRSCPRPAMAWAGKPPTRLTRCNGSKLLSRSLRASDGFRLAFDAFHPHHGAALVS